jgi:hypothetical protein
VPKVPEAPQEASPPGRRRPGRARFATTAVTAVCD